MKVEIVSRQERVVARDNGSVVKKQARVVTSDNQTPHSNYKSNSSINSPRKRSELFCGESELVKELRRFGIDHGGALLKKEGLEFVRALLLLLYEKSRQMPEPSTLRTHPSLAAIDGRSIGTRR